MGFKVVAGARRKRKKRTLRYNRGPEEKKNARGGEKKFPCAEEGGGTFVWGRVYGASHDAKIGPFS